VTAARWAPVSGIVFVALWLIAFIAVPGDSVSSSDTDADILAYYADSGNRDKELAAFFMLLAASLLFVWFVAVLRGRLASAEGGAGGLTAAAFGGGLVAAALWCVAISMFTVVPFTIEDTSKFTLDPNTFRVLTDGGYMVWISATAMAALTVFSTAVLGLKGEVVPRWFAWLSFVVAASMLVTIFFVPFFVFLGWVLVVSLLLIWKPRGFRAADAAAASAAD
jgi:hypothetical protein